MYSLVRNNTSSPAVGAMAGIVGDDSTRWSNEVRRSPLHFSKPLPQPSSYSAASLPSASLPSSSSSMFASPAVATGDLRRTDGILAPPPPTQPPVPTSTRPWQGGISPASGDGGSVSSASGTGPTSRPFADEPELSLAESAEAKVAGATRKPPPARIISSTLCPDPVDMRMLSIHEAEHLVACFHEHLNPLIKILDRFLHSTSFLRNTSTVLFGAVLATSAKFFRKDLYSQLLAQAQQLVSRALSDTISHIGVIQALCMLVFWKEPQDRSAWMRVGWCLRLATQLKLYTVREGPLPPDEMEARLIMVNIEIARL
ncbi:hypothetical protein T439DRAFT_152636 [Meredithblackwellia eburnea MCA 4105]